MWYSREGILFLPEGWSDGGGCEGLILVLKRMLVTAGLEV